MPQIFWESLGSLAKQDALPVFMDLGRRSVSQIRSNPTALKFADRVLIFTTSDMVAASLTINSLDALTRAGVSSYVMSLVVVGPGRPFSLAQIHEEAQTKAPGITTQQIPHAPKQAARLLYGSKPKRSDIDLSHALRETPA